MECEAPAARLRLQQVSRRFGGISAVDDVSLAIAPGECFCLLGASGSGKTTLLRLIAGFETPDAGRIFLDGEDITGVPAYRRPLNIMFQSYALFPHMSVAANIGFGLRQAGLPKAAVAARVAELLELVQLNGLDSRKPGQLSGGQKQRVALARALARRPKVLLLDEPLAALDRKLRGETRAELKEIQRKLGATFVIVTHDPEEAMTMAGRIGIMRNGRLVQTGPPREIYEQPRDRDVASLLGDVNIFEGIVSRAGGSGFTFDCPRLGQEIAAMGAARAGERVCVAVRPERVRAVMPGEAAAVNRIEGVVRDAAFRGSNALLRVAAGGALILAESGAPGRNFVREETVTLCFDPEAAAVLET